MNIFRINYSGSWLISQWGPKHETISTGNDRFERMIYVYDAAIAHWKDSSPSEEFYSIDDDDYID